MFEILIYIFKGIGQLLMWTWPFIAIILGAIAFQNFRKSKWVESIENVVLSVKIPKNSEKGPTSAEMMFASLHGILKSDTDLKKEGSIQEHFSFEMVADSKSIVFYIWTPKHLQNFVEGQVYAQYPTAEISTVEDYSRNIDIDNDGIDDCVAGCELKLIKPDFFPIKTFVSFEVDPLAGITGSLSKIEDQSEKVWIQILTRPVSDSWRNKGLNYAESLKNGTKPKLLTKQGIMQELIILPITIITTVTNALFPPEDTKSGGGDSKLPHNVETSLACLEEKANKLGYQVKVRILYIAKSRELALQNLRTTAGAFKQFNTTVANGFVPSKIRTGNEVLEEYRARLFHDKGFVLNIEEVASLYHLPHASVETPNIVWTSSKKGEPPENLPYADDPDVDKDDVTLFAETTFRGKLRRFGIKKDDRRRHMYVLGKSGTGKSKMLEILAVEDIKRGEGVGIVDPHGELIHDVLKQIPSYRVDDVVYINPADKDYPVGFNPMKATPELREGVASGFVSVFKKQFGYSWGPRLEYLMRYAILALTYYPDTTMLDVVKILTDKDFRKKVLTYVEDPVVKTFWLKEFSTYNDKFATEAVAPILNKVGQFTASPTIRNIIGQTKETFDFEEAMNSQKIILVDLSSGKIGEDNSELLGSLMITKMQLAAMARARIKPEDRKDFFLYVDEFQNFATDSFAKILSEARKYRLSLVLANQYVAQMEETVRDAVFGNVGTLISFRVGATDASYLEKEFSPTFEKDDLVSLDNQHMYLNMLIDGVATTSFSAKSIFVEEGTEGNTEKIIELSRKKYSRPREEIEEQIKKWSNVDNIDVDGAIERQNDSKFDGNDYVRNSQIKNREQSFAKPGFTKKYDNTVEGRPQYKKETPASRPLNQTSKNNEAVPIKKSVDPDQLKKIIQRLTQPKITSTEPKKETVGKNALVEHSIPRTTKPELLNVNTENKAPEREETVSAKSQVNSNKSTVTKEKQTQEDLLLRSKTKINSNTENKKDERKPLTQAFKSRASAESSKYQLHPDAKEPEKRAMEQSNAPYAKTASVTPLSSVSESHQKDKAVEEEAETVKTENPPAEVPRKQTNDSQTYSVIKHDNATAKSTNLQSSQRSSKVSLHKSSWIPEQIPKETQNEDRSTGRNEMEKQEERKPADKVSEPYRSNKIIIQKEISPKEESSLPIEKIEKKPETTRDHEINRPPVKVTEISELKMEETKKPVVSGMKENRTSAPVIKNNLTQIPRKETKASPENKSEKTEIKITKIHGGAEIEKVSLEDLHKYKKLEELKHQAEILKRQKLSQITQNPIQGTGTPFNQGQTSRAPRMIPVSKFGQGLNQNRNEEGIEDDNVRRISREEFLELKEIHPNEKIIIVEKNK